MLFVLTGRLTRFRLLLGSTGKNDHSSQCQIKWVNTLYVELEGGPKVQNGSGKSSGTPKKGFGTSSGGKKSSGSNSSGSSFSAGGGNGDGTVDAAVTFANKMVQLDEPTAALDFGNQQLVLSRMRMLSQMGKGVIMVTHDPDHALYCADRVIVMEDGWVIKQGTAAECITTEVIRRIYRTDARVLDVEVEPGVVKRVCVPLS